MPRYYFDFVGDIDAIDLDGIELTDRDAATRAAVATLGDVAKDWVRRNPRGYLMLRLRDDEGTVMEIRATVETTMVRAPP